MATLGVDLGTGSVKAAMVGADGKIRIRASHTYRVDAPHPGWAECDPAAWLSATQDVVARVTGLLGEAPEAVGLAGQMHGVVVVDDHFQPLRPAILWADSRSASQTQALAEALPREALSRLGSPAVAGFAATTIAWLEANEPLIMERAAYVMQPKDWLRVMLGGERATDPSDASGTLLYDIMSGTWSRTALAWAGLEESLLSPLRASTAPSGALKFGSLAEEVPSVVGGADTACALLGLGLAPGDGFVAVGSGAQVVRVMSQPRLDQTLRTHTFATAGAIGAGWYRMAAMLNSGLALSTALSWLGASIEEATAALGHGVEASDPIFTPYLAGERTPFMNPQLRGSWDGLSLATDRAAMLRSVLEAVAQAVALGVDAVQSSGDRLPDVVPLIGGGTHDPAFRQLLADASGLALAIAEAPDAAVVGAAVLAGGPAITVRRAAPLGTVEPHEVAGRLLRERRQKMVELVLSKQEGEIGQPPGC